MLKKDIKCMDKRFLKANQRHYNKLLKKLLSTNELIIFESVRPVVYYNHNEYMEDCFRYSLDGSGFIIKHANAYLFLTARHVLHGKSSIHKTLEFSHDIDIIIPRYLFGNFDLKDETSRLNLNYVYSMPIPHELCNSFEKNDEANSEFNNMFFSKESRDISIITLNEDFLKNSIQWQHQAGSSDLKDLGYLSSGDTLVSIGFPKKFNHIIPNEEQQNSSMQIERCVLFGKCIGTDAVEGVMRIDFSCKNLKNIDGMSGSPVFKLDDEKKLKFVGMVISADTKSGKCLRFLNVNWLNIYLMQTDLAFPYSSQGLETLEQIANNYLKDLEHLVGEDNVLRKDDNVILTLPSGEFYSFHKTHSIYYMVVKLLFNTNAYKSEYIYKLTNILNFTNKLEDGYAILKQNKNKINVDLIDNLDQMLHDIDYFENGSFKLNEIEKLFLV